jgi:type III secretion system low calcium response chaperone LcrH/SycD
MSESYTMTNTAPAPADSLIGRLRQSLEALDSSSRLSRTDTEAIYAMAYNLVTQGQIELANGYLSLLTLYAPTNTKYLSGLALTYKLLKAYDAALSVYTFAAALEPRQPKHMLALAECQMLQGDGDGARESLKLVIAFCADYKEFEVVSVRAQAISDLMGPARVPEDDAA